MFVSQWNKRNAIFLNNISIIDEWWITLLIVLHILAFHHHTNKWYSNIHLINTHWVTSSISLNGLRLDHTFWCWFSFRFWFRVLSLLLSVWFLHLGWGFWLLRCLLFFVWIFLPKQFTGKPSVNHIIMYTTTSIIYMIKTQFLKILNALSYNCIFQTVTMK